MLPLMPRRSARWARSENRKLLLLHWPSLMFVGCPNWTDGRFVRNCVINGTTPSSMTVDCLFLLAHSMTFSPLSTGTQRTFPCLNIITRRWEFTFSFFGIQCSYPFCRVWILYPMYSPAPWVRDEVYKSLSSPSSSRKAELCRDLWQKIR